MHKRNIALIHPGEILLEEFMKPMNISQYRLAKEIHVSPMRISEIIHGKRAITADTAIRFGCYFNMEAKFWVNLQASFDLENAIIESQEKIYHQIKPIHKAA